jgi:F-type H+-transporting ATPase subunit b
MISINATLFIQVIHFLILAYVLNRFLFRPIRNTIADRDRHIEETRKAVANIETETRELVDKCLALERDARKSAGEESNDIRKEAIAASDKLFEDTRKEIAVIRKEVDDEVDQQMDQAKVFLNNEAAMLADEIIEKVIGRRIDN